MKTKTNHFWIYSFTAISMVLIFTSGCEKDDSSPQFPECAGIRESFDPYNIVNPYSGKIWNEDTVIYTQFIFTDYKDYDIFLYVPVPGKGNWTMWIKFTSNSTTRYQSADCHYSYEDENYYAFAGFDFNGQYTNWNFYFETFDCSELSGLCNVIRPEISDTLIYRFEGTR